MPQLRSMLPSMGGIPGFFWEMLGISCKNLGAGGWGWAGGWAIFRSSVFYGSWRTGSSFKPTSNGRTTVNITWAWTPRASVFWAYSHSGSGCEGAVSYMTSTMMRVTVISSGFCYVMGSDQLHFCWVLRNCAAVGVKLIHHPTYHCRRTAPLDPFNSGAGICGLDVNDGDFVIQWKIFSKVASLC